MKQLVIRNVCVFKHTVLKVNRTRVKKKNDVYVMGPVLDRKMEFELDR